MSYSQPASRLAAPRTNTGLIPQLQFVARRLYFSAPTASPRNRAFLQEFASGEGRYQLVALQRLIECSRLSLRPEDREALPETIRGEILAGAPLTFDIAVAFDLETQATADAELPQREYERRRCPASRQLVIERLTTQLHRTRAALDAVLADRVQ